MALSCPLRIILGVSQKSNINLAYTQGLTGCEEAWGGWMGLIPYNPDIQSYNTCTLYNLFSTLADIAPFPSSLTGLWIFILHSVRR